MSSLRTWFLKLSVYAILKMPGSLCACPRVGKATHVPRSSLDRGCAVRIGHAIGICCMDTHAVLLCFHVSLAYACYFTYSRPNSNARGCAIPCLDETNKPCGCADSLCVEPAPPGVEHNRQWVVYEVVQPKTKGGKGKGKAKKGAA